MMNFEEMRRILQGIVLGSVLTLVASCGDAGGDSAEGVSGNPYQPPTENSGVSGERNFAVLLRQGLRAKVNRMPWAGYWFPYLSEGVTSAARKYQAATGTSGAVSWELRNHGSATPGVENWWGHCNGWAASAVLVSEPKASANIGSESFDVAEQKALLAEIGMEVSADFFGRRENSPSPSGRTFEDIYPNQFFLVLANYVGRGFPIIMDRYTGYQVWNHPVAGYELEPVGANDILGPHSEATSVHRVNMSARVWWLRADVDENHQTEPFSFADGASYESRLLRFELWLDGPIRLDSAGRVVESGDVILVREGEFVLGGAWKNSGLSAANSHPDYVWIPHQFLAGGTYRNPGIDPSVITRSFR